MTLQTGSGDVDANVATDRLTTRTGSGDIDLRLGNAPNHCPANSGSGDVDIRVPDGAELRVDAQTGSGDTDIDLVPQHEHRPIADPGRDRLGRHQRQRALTARRQRAAAIAMTSSI